jgi:tetratricopeptide (TPR) repeat protein
MVALRASVTIFVVLAVCAGRGYGQDAWQKLTTSAEQALREKNYETAIKLAGEAIAAKPDQPAALLLRAKAYSAASRPREAIADLDRLTNLMPQAAGLLEMRGSERFKLRQFDQAIADFGSAAWHITTLGNSTRGATSSSATTTRKTTTSRTPCGV